MGALAMGLPGTSSETLAQTGMRVCGSPENARKFIEGMLDEKVREQMEKNPARVIASYGIQVPRGMVPKTIKLPPADEVRALLKAIDSGQGTVEIHLAVFIVFLAFFAFFAFRQA